MPERPTDDLTASGRDVIIDLSAVVDGGVTRDFESTGLGSISTSATCAPLRNADAVLILITTSSGCGWCPHICARVPQAYVRSVPGTRYRPAQKRDRRRRAGRLCREQRSFADRSCAPTANAPPWLISERERSCRYQPAPGLGIAISERHLLCTCRAFGDQGWEDRSAPDPDY